MTRFTGSDGTGASGSLKSEAVYGQTVNAPAAVAGDAVPAGAGSSWPAIAAAGSRRTTANAAALVTLISWLLP